MRLAARQLPSRLLHSSSAMASGGSGRFGDLSTLGSLHVGARVLIVGDGNFSYSRAFLRANEARVADGAVDVTASSYDGAEQLAAMYPNSGEILRELAAGGVRVLHGVDATALERCEALPAAPFDRIVFNFPHFAAGGNRRNKISRHRQLLREFFTSAQRVLAQDGQVWVTLCRGQGGTPMDEQRAPRAFGDTWQVVHCAADAGLILASAHDCPVDTLDALGYYSVGYQLREKAFWTQDSVSHVFVKEGGDAVAQYPIKWTRDLSVWADVDDHELLDKLVWSAVKEQFPPPSTVETSKLDVYTCEKTARTAVTYRVEVASSHEALSRERMNERTARAQSAIESSPYASSRGQ